MREHDDAMTQTEELRCTEDGDLRTEESGDVRALDLPAPESGEASR